MQRAIAQNMRYHINIRILTKFCSTKSLSNGSLLSFPGGTMGSGRSGRDDAFVGDIDDVLLLLLLSLIFTIFVYLALVNLEFFTNERLMCCVGDVAVLFVDVDCGDLID